MVSSMSFYEHTIIAKQDISTPEIEKIEKKYKDIINETDGEVIKVEKWGLLSFAKKIRSYNNNSVLRHLTIKYKKLDTETEYFKEKDSNEKKK